MTNSKPHGSAYVAVRKAAKIMVSPASVSKVKGQQLAARRKITALARKNGLIVSFQ